MKAIILHGKHDISLGDFPAPALHEGEVLVKVAYCGICGSDLHKYEGRQNTHPIRYPVPLGHEISGVVEKVGDKIEGISVGDRVTVDPNWSCGKCYFCQKGMPAFCERARGVVKGMAEYVAAPTENLYILPPELGIGARLGKKVGAKVITLCCTEGTELDRLSDTVIYGYTQGIYSNRSFGGTSRLELMIITRTIVEYLVSEAEISEILQ